MITDISNSTSELVKFSLNLLSMQHAYIANNIANSTTNSYYPSKIDFSRLYEDVSNEINAGSSVKPVLERIESDLQVGHYVKTSNVNGVELDKETIELSKNTIKYKALLSALANHGDLLKIVLNSEGRK